DLAEQRCDLLLVARIRAERMDLAALLGDLGHQVFQLVGVATGDHRGVALAREATGDGAARRIPCADHDADLVFGHRGSPSPPLCRRQGEHSTEIKSWPLE